MKQTPERSIACPWCHATPGQPCVVPSNGRALAASHDARTSALVPAAPLGTGTWPQTTGAAS